MRRTATHVYSMQRKGVVLCSSGNEFPDNFLKKTGEWKEYLDAIKDEKQFSKLLIKYVYTALTFDTNTIQSYSFMFSILIHSINCSFVGHPGQLFSSLSSP